MTSISNYESVELPFETEKKKKSIFDFTKKFKGKKFDFVLKKLDP